MNNISAQETYSITLDDSVATSSSSVTSIDLSGLTTYSTGSTITLNLPTPTTTYSFTNSNSNDTITFSNIFATEYGTEEWRDCFPGWTRIQDMCEQYPGLKIAFEKFKTTYYLVKDDYDTPKTEK